jgi:cytochrome c-type biogenesis protein CcmE
MSKGLQIALGASVIAVLLGWYTTTNLQAGATFQYYQTLDELLESDAQGKVRVHGYVALGSIDRDVEEKRVRFRVVNDPPHASAGGGGEALAVVYASLETPDLFKDGAEVVVEGHLVRGEGGPSFEASNVLAKCPSKFQAAATEQGSL